MEYKRLLGAGSEGNVYNLGNGICLKVYCRSNADISALFSRAREVFEVGIPIPEPLALTTTTLTEADNHFSGRLCDLLWNTHSVGTHAAILMKYIEGTPLSQHLFPSRSRREKLVALHQKITDAGFVYTDRKLKNHLETEDGKLYICDIGGFEKLEEHTEALQIFLLMHGQRSIHHPSIASSRSTEPLPSFLIR